MKHIGFLSFGHWTPSPQSQTRSASDALLQSIELAVAAEELGADGAYFRVHHFARQLGSPFPLLAAVGARTKRIEIGTAVIDMRYENPLYMAEDAGAADLIAGGRLQLGISRGSPEQVIDGWRYFGYAPAEGESDADMARRHTEVFLEVLRGEGFAKPNPRPMFPNPPGLLRLEPHSEGLRERIWWGAGTNATAEWAAQARHEPAKLDAEDRRERQAVPRPAGGADPALSRGVEGGGAHAHAAGVGVAQHLRAGRRHATACISAAATRRATRSACSSETERAIFGRSYAAEPDVLIEQLKGDEAIAEADTLLLTVPNQLGVDYNAHVIESDPEARRAGVGLAVSFFHTPDVFFSYSPTDASFYPPPCGEGRALKARGVGVIAVTLRPPPRLTSFADPPHKGRVKRKGAGRREGRG